MGLIFRLSLRNLLRQKKRNLFLGIGIAFGMAILVIANSFSHGMVDVLIQDIVSNAFGHLVVDATPGNSFYSVIRDKERIEEIIYEAIPNEDIVYLAENLGMMGTAIGRGESDNVFIVGVSADTEEEQDEFFYDFFTLVDGSFDDYNTDTYQYPIIISEQKAESLNVGVHDTIRVRFPMVTGQIQAERFTVIAIANANNSFMDMVLFMNASRVKRLLGYQPWESAGIQISLRDPKGTATKYANILQEKLQPRVLSVRGEVEAVEAHLLAFRNSNAARQELLNSITIVEGDVDQAFSTDGVLISQTIADQIGLIVGESFSFSYESKYRGIRSEDLVVNAIFSSNLSLLDNVVLVNEEVVHPVFDRYLPGTIDTGLVPTDSPIHSALATEWKILDRTSSMQEMMEQAREERRVRTGQTKYKVMTMYEGAAEILQLEEVLNLVTVLAVMVLFVIILIGVMNTLRMTVQERTREIGTLRAIGMQKRDVRNMFIAETLILTVLACVAGLLFGLLVMGILGSIEFDTTSVISMILKNKRIFFKLNPAAVVQNFVLILFMAGLTALFPARRAASLQAVEALRHFE